MEEDLSSLKYRHRSLLRPDRRTTMERGEQLLTAVYSAFLERVNKLELVRSQELEVRGLS